MSTHEKDLTEAQLKRRLQDTLKDASPGYKFPYELLDELLELITTSGRLSTSLRVLGISQRTLLRLMEEAESGDEVAIEVLSQIDAALALFETDLLKKVQDNPHNALVKLLDKATPDDWHDGVKATGKDQSAGGAIGKLVAAGGAVILGMPSNGREPEAIDVEVVEND